jgi:hypothetical protein
LSVGVPGIDSLFQFTCDILLQPKPMDRPVLLTAGLGHFLILP